MSEIVDFMKLQKNYKDYDYIYAGNFRDYYLNIVAVLCDINIFYYLDTIDYNIEKGNVIIIFDQTISVDENMEDIGSSIENIIQTIRNKNKSFFTNEIKFLYKDIKSNTFKGGIYNVQEDDIEPSKEIPEEKVGSLSEIEQFELYEFEILDKVFNPILTF
jgi:hypothetical protein